MGGCTSKVNNTFFAERIRKYTLAIKDVMSMQNKLKVDSNYPLNCFLVSANSVKNLLQIILNKNNDGSIDLTHLNEYELETNIQIYDDINICKNILEINKEKNDFIIVSEIFLKNMEINEGKDVKLEKEKSQIKEVQSRQIIFIHCLTIILMKRIHFC